MKLKKELDVNFADDYIKYVKKKNGVISAKDIELTGVTNHKGLSVISITKKKKKKNTDFQDTNKRSFNTNQLSIVGGNND